MTYNDAAYTAYAWQSEVGRLRADKFPFGVEQRIIVAHGSPF